MLHALKTEPVYFDAVSGGTKTFEVRKHDRPFMPGDDIILQEWIEESKKYTGREWRGEIIYLMDNPDYCKKGYCVLGIKPKNIQP